MRALFVCMLCVVWQGWPAAPEAAGAEPARVLPVQILAQYPHDPQAFTQGLFVLPGGDLAESTGLYGRSEMRRVRLKDGAVLQRERLSADLFGEGAALTPQGVVQLTWREGRALVRDPKTLALRGEHRYTGEGWGLAFDGSRLFMSDGSARLFVRDPATFARLGEVRVMDGKEPVDGLNELEWLPHGEHGLLLANVWQTPHVVVIEPQTGRVLLRLDLSECWRRSGCTDERFVPNGIAWDERTGLLVTGKGWPLLFRVAWPPPDAGFDTGPDLR